MYMLWSQREKSLQSVPPGVRLPCCGSWRTEEPVLLNLGNEEAVNGAWSHRGALLQVPVGSVPQFPGIGRAVPWMRPEAPEIRGLCYQFQGKKRVPWMGMEGVHSIG